jgi:glycosyltransferase involved in cell wall biosynthesis
VKRRIVHVTTVHRWDDVRIFRKECASLAGAGHDVTLIVPVEDLNVVGRRECGVRIVPLRRAKGRAGRMLAAPVAAFRAAVAENADLYHLHDPELMPWGWLLRRLGKRVVYDAHEDLPKQTLGKEWIPRWLRWPIGRAGRLAEVFAARAFDGIVAATESIAANFSTPRKAVVRNFPLPAEFAGGTGRPYAERRPLVAYVGGLTRDRGLITAVDAMHRLPDRLEARLVLAGSFAPPSFEGVLRDRPGWRRAEHRGHLGRGEVSRLLSEARVGLVTLWPQANYLEALPVKLFEYMMAGLPVVASDFPAWRPLVAGPGCGLLVDPADPAAVAGAIRWLLEHPAEAEAMGRRGQEAVTRQWTWHAEFRKLEALYAALLGCPFTDRGTQAATTANAPFASTARAA